MSFPLQYLVCETAEITEVSYITLLKIYRQFADLEKGPEEGIGVGNEEERYTRGNGESSL